MKKTLILKVDNDDIVLRKLENCDIEKYYNCNVKNFIFRVFKKFNLKISSVFLGKWKKNIKDYKVVILFDNGYSKIVTRYIKKKNPDCKVILWFWNPIIEYSKNYLLDKNIDEIWSYDKDDVKKYNLKFSPQFFNKEIKCNNKKIEQDIIFLGQNKGRKSIIEKYEKLFNENNVNNNKIIIIESEKDFISYEDYLELVGKSKAILDIVMDNVKGLTLRCVEALFFGKKLITNNEDIKNYTFYNPNNIFILGKDDITKIKEFIDSPYTEINKDIVDYYDFEQWLKRFGV